MGKVTAVKVTHKNGSVRYLTDLQGGEAVAEEERAEYEYKYSPELLPSLIWSNDGMWRYRALLPIEHRILYPLTVGGTPLVSAPQIREWAGIQKLWLKDETRSPTGSNKDRATALVLEQALYSGINTVSCASTGNVAVSLAVGAAAAGVKAVIFVPMNVSCAKLQMMLFSGATVFKVKEGYEASVALSRAAARLFKWYDRNTGYNPLTVEAKKTVSFEVWEQLDRQIPDVVVAPVGDGVTLNGIAKGFRELLLCGVPGKLPRIIGVQAEGCQPVKRAWEGVQLEASTYGATEADGIAVVSPINGELALRDVRESGGDFIAVSDETILQTIRILAAKGGILAEPAGVVALAGARQAVVSGLIGRSEMVVALITGSGLKTPQYLCADTFRHAFKVSAQLSEVEQIYKSALREDK